MGDMDWGEGQENWPRRHMGLALIETEAVAGQGWKNRKDLEARDVCED